MPIPLRYNVRSIFYRKTTTALTLLAISLTVCVLCIVLALQQGFVRSGERSGDPRNVICLRKSSTNEGDSSVSLEGAKKLLALPEVARLPDGSPFGTAEIYSGVSAPREGGKGRANVSVRGTSPVALKLREKVKIVEGVMFTPGRRELVVGRGLVDRFRGCRVGGVFTLQDEEWPVVGVLDGGGSSFDSEIWGDAEIVRTLFTRSGWNTVIFRADTNVDIGTPEEQPRATGDSAEELLASSSAGVEGYKPPTGLLGRLAGDEFQLAALTEPAYFVKQSGFLGAIIGGLAGLLALIMSAGSVFGCTNTLLAAVAGRTREIGSLMAIGFRPRDILFGFLIEALVLGLLGGVLGVLLALPVNGMATGTLSFSTFTEATFAFEITPFVVVVAMAVAAAVGLVGGVIPAVRAARLKPVEALRGE